MKSVLAKVNNSKERQNLNMALIGPEELVAQEFNQYTKEPTQSEEQCTFDYWKQNHTSFPLMSIAAAQILAVQSSNCSSERDNSVAGQIITNKRHNLSEVNAEVLIWSRLNKD